MLNGLLVFIGIILFMSLYIGLNRQDFFSDASIDIWNSALVSLTTSMPGRRFNQILRALTFTTASHPAFKDRFWEMRQLIVE